MDKFFLLTYTYIAQDGERHMSHAWFGTERELKDFVEAVKAEGKEPEVDLAIEILSHREIEF